MGVHTSRFSPEELVVFEDVAKVVAISFARKELTPPIVA